VAEKRAPAVEALRRRIDALDLLLVRLLAQRVRHTVRIGRLKRRLGLPRYSSAREAVILRRVVAAGRPPLDALAIRRVFRRVLAESRRLAEAQRARGTHRA
jgi:chorismate mutase